MTSDDELIERIRRTLHAQASSITPAPEPQPVPGYRAITSIHPNRVRWPLAAVTAVAAAIALVVFTWPSSPAKVNVNNTVPPAHPSTVQAPTSVPTVTNSRPVATTYPPTTVPMGMPLPSGFQPQSVTFVSSQDGWVLGITTCNTVRCFSMAKTQDGGRTWSLAAGAPYGVPPRQPFSGGSGVEVRFANQLDGWVVATDATQVRRASRVWSTHNGGASWAAVAIPALETTGTVSALETSGGVVHLVVTEGPDVSVFTSPDSQDIFRKSPVSLTTGAGPVPSSELVLQRKVGWIVQNDRTVVDGATLAGGQWASWQPPCLKANGSMQLAASSPTSLVALCNENTFGPASNLPNPGNSASQWLFASSDGGSTFTAVGQIPQANEGALIAAASPQTVVIAGTGPYGGLSTSFNGGHTWLATLSDSSVANWVDLGFTNPSQGVAIAVRQNSSQLLFTRDGGHTWQPVNFGSS